VEAQLAPGSISFGHLTWELGEHAALVIEAPFGLDQPFGC
jgi:hypothetical protein